MDGHRSFWRLPWSLVGTGPLFDNVLPARLALYVTLLTAIIVALWIAARKAGFPLAASRSLPSSLSLIPNWNADKWASGYSVPPFFTDSAYRGCLHPDENILPLPISANGQSMLWQALANYRFRMAGGYITPEPPDRFLAPTVVELVALGYPVAPSQPDELRFYFRAEDVTAVLLDPSKASRWAGALDRIATPHDVGGVILYRIKGSSPPCPAR